MLILLPLLLSLFQLYYASPLPFIFAGPLDNPELDERLRIIGLNLPAQQPADQWIYIPAVLLLGFLFWRQKKRRKLEGTA